MAILIEFTTLVIRLDRLRGLGGDAVARVRERWGPCWFDEHFLAVGFMGEGAGDLARELEGMGLVLRDTSSGMREWRDICVVDVLEGPTNPCSWLRYHPIAQVAWRAGIAPGDLAGPPRGSGEALLHVPEAEVLRHLAPLYPLAPPPMGAEERHEGVLLPLALRVGGELLAQVGDVDAFKGIVFRARFPAPGEVYTLGLTLWSIQRATCRGELPKVSPAAMDALIACSNHAGDYRLTGLALTIQPSGDCEVDFTCSLLVPSRADAVEALNQSFAALPEGQPEAPFRRIPEGADALPLRLVPLPWPLYLVFDAPALDGSNNLDEEDAPPTSLAEDEPPASGSRFVVSLEEGPILRAMRGLRSWMKLTDVVARHPTLRPIDAIKRRFVLALGDRRLGDLVFHFPDGRLAGAVCDTVAGASFDALLARRATFARALGGLGPLTDLDETPLDDMEALRERVVSAPSGRTGVTFRALEAPDRLLVTAFIYGAEDQGQPIYGLEVKVSWGR
jgi:hypothetical protein